MTELFTRVKTVECILCKERFTPKEVYYLGFDNKIRYLCKDCCDFWDQGYEHFYENDVQYLEYLKWLRGLSCKLD